MNRVFRNRIVIAIIALILAIVLGAVFFLSVKSGSEKTNVVKVSTNISKGVKITDDMVKIEEVGKYNLGDVATDKSQVVGKYAQADLFSGDLVLNSKVNNTSTGNDDKLSQLNGTKSAMSITVKTFADGLSDKILEGDVVSCIITKNEQTTTPAELNYVEVIATTQKDGTDKDKSTSDNKQNVATVTLLVNQKQAEILANADVNADVHLALVYRGDKDTAQKFIAEQDSKL